ncbi:hypothetical protein MBLNU457_g0834t1 [Dothideomycetes sp. NU457]
MYTLFPLIALLIASGNAAPVSHQPGQEYTVVFNSSHPEVPAVTDVLSQLSLSPTHPDVRHVYNNHAFHGFHATMNTHCLSILTNMSNPPLIEPAIPIRTATTAHTTITARINAPWNLERISTVSAPNTTLPSLSYTYTYLNPILGRDVDIYILDTGALASHITYTNRAVQSYTFDASPLDNDGHGTHVTGIAAGAAIGVASSANIRIVKALDVNGTGFSSNVVGAIDYVLSSHASRRTRREFKGSVINMSLEGGGISQAMNLALQAASQAGIHVVVAAGNAGSDACGLSPASAGGVNGDVITVGSVGMSDRVSAFSNTGACVDVFAPGEEVLSAWNTGDGDLRVLSGTSMAAPHVAGIVAYAIAGNETLAGDVKLMKDWVRGTALRGVVTGRTVLGEELLLANNGMPLGPRGSVYGLIQD